MNNKVKTLTRCALFTALGGALLYISAFLPTLSLSIIALAGLTISASVIHDRVGAGFSVYFATVALSFLIVPDKGNVILYAAFFGLYPVLKSIAERPKTTLVCWLLKLLYFNGVFLCMWFFGKELLFGELPDIPFLMLIAAAVANAVFVIYDIGFDKLISYYIYAVARRIH